jgi:hypothetical protein
MFGWEEVYMCFSMDDFVKARDAVEREGIPYKRKIFAHSGTWLGRGNVRGRHVIIGGGPDYTKQYRMLVKNEDAEQAMYLIRQAGLR